MNLLNCLGVGTVTSTKQTDSKEITVSLPLYNMMADGREVATAQTSVQTSQTADGTNKTSQVLGSNSVTAKWMGDGGNRMTAPDVREGTPVAIYRYGDSDQLLWTLHGVDTKTKRLETVVWGFSANPNLDENAEFSLDNYYTFEISTHTGKVGFMTSQANGEKTKYQFQVDAQAGTVLLGDGEGNIIATDSMSHTTSVRNQDGSEITLAKMNILIKCADTFGISADKLLSIICKQMLVSAQDVNVVAPAGVNIKANTSVIGNLGVAGNITTIAGEGGDGTMQCSGTINAEESINAKGDVTAGGGAVSLLRHRHSNSGGSGTGGMPVGGG